MITRVNPNVYSALFSYNKVRVLVKVQEADNGKRILIQRNGITVDLSRNGIGFNGGTMAMHGWYLSKLSPETINKLNSIIA